MAKRVLVVSSGYGYRNEELSSLLRAPETAGYETEFMTPRGTESADPALGCGITGHKVVDMLQAGLRRCGW